ncbi:MAG: ShlB/FhaC/HecB family hemolysin secretion/activation protein [Methylotenera sp.]|uniref:ShlB/FhaC/HecB family hemolysin secretion/activation protein n=1 Tax=Methylotenera sp. TaxID=2051956 RepID=UPI00271B2DD5|nr:ShlB/FhaC/HecB family hemolysin secretion/activation protein [Methylotenera sp.]MDO9151890.1 ShlB/FhaC/HecB family hemolysin secretion/activation protein [Methylotenera sp.]
MMQNKKLVPITLLAMSTYTGLLVAGEVQPQPDAGRTLQELSITPPALPKKSIEIDVKAPEIKEDIAGGISVVVETITLSGNTVYSDEVLLGVIGDYAGKSYDLAAIKNLANLITTYYRSHGYPFARAYIPAQSMTDGKVNIEVIEGRYNNSTINSTDAKAQKGAQKFLDYLKTGDVIDSRKLERTILILSDQPGYKATPVVSPGEKVGTADLDVSVVPDKKYGGDIGIDNYGNRYTGRLRGSVNLYVNSPFVFGDQLRVSTLYSEEDLWLGSVNYSLPVGGSGLRANFGYAHTSYDLGKEFAVLDATGTAQVASMGLSYPIIRSQTANLTIGANYQHKKLQDNQGVSDQRDSKYSNSLPISLSFDLVDQLFGGGVTYGSVSWTHGDLNLDSSLSAVDRQSAKTEGTFDKYNFDIARLQALPGNFSFLGRLSMQVASDNLDSSEKFGLGGINGVRAYPSGEGFGDEGSLARLELRYDINQFTPYAFYDIGTIKFNHNEFSNGDNRRTVAGSGLGLRFNTASWTADTSLAWRNVGGNPLSDTKDYQPMFWAGARYKF